MAINVNTAYTTVLSILNKEQRGYLTPDEFNKIGTQVQLEVFEKFFEDYNQYIRMPKTNVEFASRMDHIMEEFQVFEKSGPSIAIPTGSAQTNNIYNQPSDLHRFGSVTYNKGVNSPPIEIVANREYNQLRLSPLTLPTANFPVAKYNQNQITVFPTVTDNYANTDVTFNYIRKPLNPRWGYSIGSLGQYIYDATVFGADLLNNGGVLLSYAGLGTTGIVGDYPAVAYTGGTGTGLVINAKVITTSTVTFTIATPGTGYVVGDEIAVNAAQLGATSNLVTITLTAADFNSGSTFGSTDFEISDSQQTEVILEILKYSGIVIRDPQIIQAASRELAQEEVNSKR